MTKYIYEPEGIECPECGEVTRELFNIEQNGQEVMMCDACSPINMKRLHRLANLRRGWERGGINE